MPADEFDWNDPFGRAWRFERDIERYAEALGISRFQAELRVTRQQDILREFRARQRKDENNA